MTPLIENRKARRDYTILSTIEAGIVLRGHEVKAVRGKRAQISDAYVKVIQGEAYLVNARIEQLLTVAHIDYDPTASRKLLLKRRQIRELEEQLQAKGLTAVPLALGVVRNHLKLLIGIGKGKKTFERKEELKRRDLARESASDLRRSGRHH